MEDIEAPLEKVTEDIQHAAHHAPPEGQRFVNRAALLSAFLAALAAVSALFAGHDANEAMVAQIKSSDQWAYYQAKGIKASIAELQASSTSDPAAKAAALAKAEKYKSDQDEIKGEAEDNEKEAERLLGRHESVASSVTFFQVAIALTAIAVLSKKKPFLLAALISGGVGVAWLARSYLWGH